MKYKLKKIVRPTSHVVNLKTLKVGPAMTAEKANSVARNKGKGYGVVKLVGITEGM